MSKSLTLTPDEYKILKYIVQNGKTTPKEVAVNLNLPSGKVDSLLPDLADRGLIKRTTKQIRSYKLTARGSEVSNGLPERILVETLQKKGRIQMKDLQKEVPLTGGDTKAAIGILRKASIIKIDKGMLEIADDEKARDFSLDIKDALSRVKEGQEIGDEIAVKLMKRGFTEQIETQSIEVEPVISSKELEKSTVKEEVSKVTPAMLSTGKWKKLSFKPYNIKSQPRKLYPGKFHPYRHFHDHVRTKLIGLGFVEMKGPLVEQEFWNFDALYSPQDHPAREDTDIFLLTEPTHGELIDEDYVDNVRMTHEDGWKTGSRGHRYKWDPRKAARYLLRPQGTAISARTLSKLKPPAKYFSLAKCFRPDSIDATHGVEFYQAEGIVCDPNITFRDLLGILRTFAIDVAGATEVSFRPDYYPFTSPSVELSAKHPTLGRIEFGGAGIFRPEVVRPFGIEYPVIAWGLGVDRLFMVKNEISDIRELFSQNLQWLRDVEVSSGISVED